MEYEALEYRDAELMGNNHIIKMDSSLHHPLFHHSIIPWMRLDLRFK
jgi:hypothetical protein